MKNQSNPNHSAHIVTLTGVEKHPNADRLQKAKAFGAGIVVGLDAKDGDIGVYFQSGLALDSAFATANDLIRRKNPITGAAEGGMLDANCRIRTQKFRGEVSDGLFLPLSSLTAAGVSASEVGNLIPGDFFMELDGIKICDKYVIHTRNTGGASSKLPRVEGSIMFKEHYDTAQLRFNLDAIKADDHIIVTEKVHGTSQRIANVQKVTELTGLKKFVAKLFGLGLTKITWEDMVGTRRTVVKTDGYYAKDFRMEASEPFFGKLHKGETIYYEVAGYAGDKSIMGTVDNEKLGPEFVAKYGKKTTFTYGCEPGKFKIFVYRITMTNEDGVSMDYTWDAIEKRCGELDVPVVPVLYKGVSKDFAYNVLSDWSTFGEAMERAADAYVKGESTLDNKHVREGIVVRVEGTSCPKTYKHKSFEFKVLEGILKPETASIDETSEL